MFLEGWILGWKSWIGAILQSCECVVSVRSASIWFSVLWRHWRRRVAICACAMWLPVKPHSRIGAAERFRLQAFQTFSFSRVLPRRVTGPVLKVRPSMRSPRRAQCPLRPSTVPLTLGAVWNILFPRFLLLLFYFCGGTDVGRWQWDLFHWDDHATILNYLIRYALLLPLYVPKTKESSLLPSIQTLIIHFILHQQYAKYILLIMF